MSINFAVEACVLNMYAEDALIYTSATAKDELECRLQFCIDNISNWYSMNKLCINKKKSNVMVIGSKWQYTSLTDTGATRRLVANQREVMTRLLELLYVLNIKRNIF